MHPTPQHTQTLVRSIVSAVGFTPGRAADTSRARARGEAGRADEREVVRPGRQEGPDTAVPAEAVDDSAEAVKGWRSVSWWGTPGGGLPESRWRPPKRRLGPGQSVSCTTFSCRGASSLHIDAGHVAKCVFGRPSGGSARCYRKATEPRPRHSTRSANIQLGLSVFLVPRSLVAVVHCYGHNIPYAYLRIFPMHRFAFLMHAYASYASTECLPHRCDGTRAPLSELFSLLPAACLPRPAAAPPPRSSPRPPPRPPPRGRLRRRRWCGVLPEEGVLGRAVGRPVEVLRVPECPNDAGAT